ncbi:MAG: glycosyltransferase family 2 protein [Bdellovibrionia bacterium]
MEKVIALVVTYNRQLLLSACITALRNQTRKIDLIYVVNNGSTDTTEDWLKQQQDLEFITQKNVGGAGGFYTGIKTAYEKKFSWIWLMDDDGYPKEDALEKLLEDDTNELCLRNCAVINKEDKKSFVWKTGNNKTIDAVKDDKIWNVAHPFNGTLLHRKIIERVGFPNASLFLWGDESEYFYRIIKKNGIPSYTNTKSIHYHPPSAYSFKNDWAFESNWKMYYYVRNRLFVLKTRFSNSLILAFAMYLLFIAAFAATIVLFQKSDKYKKLGFIVWPIADAFASNCSATPASVLKTLSATSRFNLRNYTLYRFRLVRSLFSSPAPSSL